eukprot:GHVT01049327.1.p1 GENE.GHVT01049327.1~~GHVT01049327.1.p1  ORF type:complete len:558 (+),score=44.29 GHVT01049327.1:412-2085(+)
MDAQEGRPPLAPKLSAGKQGQSTRASSPVKRSCVAILLGSSPRTPTRKSTEPFSAAGELSPHDASVGSTVSGGTRARTSDESDIVAPLDSETLHDREAHEEEKPLNYSKISSCTKDHPQLPAGISSDTLTSPLTCDLPAEKLHGSNGLGTCETVTGDVSRGICRSRRHLNEGEATKDVPAIPWTGSNHLLNEPSFKVKYEKPSPDGAAKRLKTCKHHAANQTKEIAFKAQSSSTHRVTCPTASAPSEAHSSSREPSRIDATAGLSILDQETDTQVVTKSDLSPWAQIQRRGRRCSEPAWLPQKRPVAKSPSPPALDVHDNSADGAQNVHWRGQDSCATKKKVNAEQSVNQGAAPTGADDPIVRVNQTRTFQKCNPDSSTCSKMSALDSRPLATSSARFPRSTTPRRPLAWAVRHGHSATSPSPLQLNSRKFVARLPTSLTAPDSHAASDTRGVHVRNMVRHFQRLSRSSSTHVVPSMTRVADLVANYERVSQASTTDLTAQVLADGSGKGVVKRLRQRFETNADPTSVTPVEPRASPWPPVQEKRQRTAPSLPKADG